MEVSHSRVRKLRGAKKAGDKSVMVVLSFIHLTAYTVTACSQSRVYGGQYPRGIAQPIGSMRNRFHMGSAKRALAYAPRVELQSAGTF